MPLEHPGTLTHNQVYSLTAWILQMNGIIGENDVLMPNAAARSNAQSRWFVPDARPDVGTKPIAKAKKAVAKSALIQKHIRTGEERPGCRDA
jgi:hypothetical protein